MRNPFGIGMSGIGAMNKDRKDQLPIDLKTHPARYRLIEIPAA
jgi:hypothetical protein